MELTESRFGEDIESRMASDIVSGEYQTGVDNNQRLRDDFQDFVDLLDAERGEREYEWMSDIRLPEFASIFLTQSSMDVASYFTQREFVDVMLEEGTPDAETASRAAKKCINKTLNRRDLYHYLKFIRSRQIASLLGPAYLKCWWEKDYSNAITGIEWEEDEKDAGSVIGRLKKEEFLSKDCFNYGVIDPRNVFTSEEYTYSVQDKEWVIIQSAKTIEMLEDEQVNAGYFNLDKLKGGGVLRSQTETGWSEREEGNEKQSAETSLPKYFDIIERYGKYWAIVEQVDNFTGQPVKIKPGIGKDGEPLDGAELIECVIIFARAGSTTTLIAFHPQPYLDANNRPYRPIIRSLCYPHPISDDGFGDGRHSRELQYAIDDTFNVSNDRTMLATLPVLTVARQNNEDNDTLFLKPDHVIELDDPSKDLKELTINDNIAGAMNQLAMLKNGMQEVTNTYPSTMGNLGGIKSSTTATAIAGADAHANKRGNFKATTFEYTGLTELYWMILQMTYQFAEPETAVDLMGELASNFDPTREYYYKPVSSAIEEEYSKQNKIQTALGMLQTFAPLAASHPSGPKVLNQLMARVLRLQGEEYNEMAGIFFDEAQPFSDGSGTPENGPGATPISNQSGVPMSMAEQSVRG